MHDGATRRGGVTRAGIVRGARVVFERDGFFGARIEDIALEAGVAPGTFYWYFTSKADVFREIATGVERDIGQALRPIRGGDQFLALQESIERYLAVYRANSAMYALMEQVAMIDDEIHQLRLAMRQKFVDRVARSIRRWQATGVADAGVDPVTTAGALVSMRSNFAYWWIAGGDVYDEETVVRTLTDIWARAVGMRRPDDEATAAAPPSPSSRIVVRRRGIRAR